MKPIQSTFLYELKLLDQYKHRSLWTDREKEIQQQHVQYLDSLTQQGILQLAGIIDQGLESRTGLVILNVGSYEETQQIVAADPSVKEGMMTARLRPLNIYFQNK